MKQDFSTENLALLEKQSKRTMYAFTGLLVILGCLLIFVSSKGKNTVEENIKINKNLKIISKIKNSIIKIDSEYKILMAGEGKTAAENLDKIKKLKIRNQGHMRELLNLNGDNQLKVFLKSIEKSFKELDELGSRAAYHYIRKEFEEARGRKKEFDNKLMAFEKMFNTLSDEYSSKAENLSHSSVSFLGTVNIVAIVILLIFMLCAILLKNKLLKTVHVIVIGEVQKLKTILGDFKILTNNMRQALFTIDSDLIITNPVSKFSDSIFGTAIVGNNIFDVVYGSLDKNSENFQKISGLFEMVFGEGELQWELEEHNLPDRVVLTIDEGFEKNDKILKIKYTPLFNEGDELQKIMFIIEDITEIERLENEMKSQQEEMSKEIQLIQELAQIEVSDIRDFFRRAPYYITTSWEILDKDIKGKGQVEELFRNLHTLKGNSRIFKFEALTTSVHEIEEILKMELEKKDAAVLSLKNEKIFSALMDIQKILQMYGDLAERVFKIENEFRASMIHQVIDSFSDIDYLLNPTRHNDKEKSQNYLKRLKTKMDDETNFEVNEQLVKLRQMVQNLGIETSSKASLILINEWDSGEFQSFYENYQILLNDILHLYSNSSLLKSYPDGPEVWAPVLKHIVVFFNKFSGDNFIIGQDKEEMTNNLSVIWSDANSQGFVLLESFGARLNDLLMANSDKAFVFLAQDMLRYICFLMDVNIDQNLDSKGKEELILILEGVDQSKYIDSLLVDFEYANINLTTLIRIIKREGFDLYGFFKNLTKFLNKESYLELFPSLTNNRKMRQIDFQVIIDQLWQLDNLESLEANHFTDTISDLLYKGFKRNMMLQRLDIIQILDGYMETEDSTRRKSNLQMVQIVATNLNQLKNSMYDLKADFTREKLKSLEKTLKHLLDIPVKKAFFKFAEMVQEISSKLGKKVDFSIRGNDFVLNRDALILLSDSIVHILRNSLDHGIETSDERIKNGKEERGQIEIVCFDYGDNFVFEIKDDGKGIDPEKVKESAIKKKIFTQEEADKLSEIELINIIFEPSFSTAAKVTHLSGRGVGMNVVKANIEKLGGKIMVNSEIDEGTEFIVTIKKD